MNFVTVIERMTKLKEEIASIESRIQDLTDRLNTSDGTEGWEGPYRASLLELLHECVQLRAELMTMQFRYGFTYRRIVARMCGADANLFPDQE